MSDTETEPETAAPSEVEAARETLHRKKKVFLQAKEEYQNAKKAYSQSKDDFEKAKQHLQQLKQRQSAGAAARAPISTHFLLKLFRHNCLVPEAIKFSEGISWEEGMQMSSKKLASKGMLEHLKHKNPPEEQNETIFLAASKKSRLEILKWLKDEKRYQVPQLQSKELLYNAAKNGAYETFIWTVENFKWQWRSSSFLDTDSSYEMLEKAIDATSFGKRNSPDGLLFAKWFALNTTLFGKKKDIKDLFGHTGEYGNHDVLVWLWDTYLSSIRQLHPSKDNATSTSIPRVQDFYRFIFAGSELRTLKWFEAVLKEKFPEQIPTPQLCINIKDLQRCVEFNNIGTLSYMFDECRHPASDDANFVQSLLAVALRHKASDVVEYLFKRKRIRPPSPVAVNSVIACERIQKLFEENCPEQVLVTENNIKFAVTTGDLNLLVKLNKFAQPTVQWPADAIDSAVQKGFLEIAKWLHDNGKGTFTTAAMDKAAASGNLETVKWLHENITDIGCTTAAMDRAAAAGHLEMVKWLHENTTTGCTTAAMDKAAAAGHLEMIKWLHENRTEGCTVEAMNKAAISNFIGIVQWLHEHRTEGCSLRTVLRFEHLIGEEIVRFLCASYGVQQAEELRLAVERLFNQTRPNNQLPILLEFLPTFDLRFQHLCLPSVVEALPQWRWGLEDMRSQIVEYIGELRQRREITHSRRLEVTHCRLDILWQYKARCTSQKVSGIRDKVIFLMKVGVFDWSILERDARRIEGVSTNRLLQRVYYAQDHEYDDLAQKLNDIERRQSYCGPVYVDSEDDRPNEYETSEEEEEEEEVQESEEEEEAQSTGAEEEEEEAPRRPRKRLRRLADH